MSVRRESRYLGVGGDGKNKGSGHRPAPFSIYSRDLSYLGLASVDSCRPAEEPFLGSVMSGLLPDLLPLAEPLLLEVPEELPMPEGDEPKLEEGPLAPLPLDALSDVDEPLSPAPVAPDGSRELPIPELDELLAPEALTFTPSALAVFSSTRPVTCRFWDF